MHTTSPLIFRRNRRGDGHSLIEMIIVVVIMAVIAAIAVPRFSRAVTDVESLAFTASLTEIINALEDYKIQTGVYPPAQVGNAMPPEITNRFPGGDANTFTFEGGGVYQYRILSGQAMILMIRFTDTPSSTGIGKVDAAIDDGNTATGAFQKVSPKLYEYKVVA